ncbi:hypothetical protein CPB86DRAFT_467356 [Serendipita vermifera]|nr:hypothetical protein CPB86DRAFT_467356 [Serendipita vermifera]
MSFISPTRIRPSPPTPNQGHCISNDNIDTQLADLMDDLLDTIQRQMCIKKVIKILLRKKEEIVEKREDEAREALLRARRETERAKIANALLNERIKQAEATETNTEDEEQEEGTSEEDTFHSRPTSPALVYGGPERTSTRIWKERKEERAEEPEKEADYLISRGYGVRKHEEKRHKFDEDQKRTHRLAKRSKND